MMGRGAEAVARDEKTTIGVSEARRAFQDFTMAFRIASFVRGSGRIGVGRILRHRG
jgi:hypothetical protein